MMIGLMEAAAADAVGPLLPEGQCSVGILVNVKHLAATPIGHEVRAEAEVIELDGKRIVFKVEAFDETEMIGEGIHVRFIVDMNRFMARMEKKTKLIGK
jgi:predicted thioesterase